MYVARRRCPVNHRNHAAQINQTANSGNSEFVGLSLGSPRHYGRDRLWCSCWECGSNPDGFEGWVVIRYDIPGEPAFDREGAKTLVKVPKSGSLSTSSDSANGYGIDEYYLVAADGQRVRVPSEAEGCKDQDPCVQQFEFITSPIKATLFFVGKKQDVSQYPKPKVP